MFLEEPPLYSKTWRNRITPSFLLGVLLHIILTKILWTSLIWLFYRLQYHFCIYFRTSSSAIYSRTVPLGDSNEYFDQIWFPSEPPGVAPRGPLCSTHKNRESAENSKPAESVQIIPNAADFSACSQFPPPSMLVSRRVYGGRNSSPVKGKVNLCGENLLLLPFLPPTRLPCHSSDVIQWNCVHYRTPFSIIQ